MGRIGRFVSVASALVLVSVVVVAAPVGALSLDKAELRGNELRLEGADAVSNADITVDGVVLGSANGNGTFDIRVSPFSSPTCVISVSDGVDTQSIELDRCTPSVGSNQDPTAMAGPDVTVVDVDQNGSETVALDGSASSDPEGPIAAFVWTEGATNLGSGSSITPTLAVGTHTITLTVTDGDGATATDTVVVTVDAPAANQPPTADAGPDITVTDDDNNGVETVILESFNSTDPEGPIASYEWIKDGVVIASANGVAISQPVGVNTITLRVTDSGGLTDTDVVIVTVNPFPIPGNNPPVAVAGPDQTVTDSDGNGVETVTLDGSASTDSDGLIVSYEWSENGTPLAPVAGGGTTALGVLDGGAFDHLFESNQADPPGIVPNSFGGSSASAGDVNGDGFGDVIIGSEVWDDGTEFAEGAAIVFLGGPNGPVGNNPSNAHALIEMNQAGATVNDVASAGDVNGDGFDDVLVGSHFYDTNLPGTQLAVDGAVFVFHGGPTGITATGPADADGAIFANQLLSGMGDQVDSAGDVNGDGFDDIVVSVPREGTLFPAGIPINDRSGEYGAILIFHGGPNGITGTGFADADTVILPYEDTGLPLPPVDASVSYGAGAGDINGDGFADIVVGGSEVTTYFGGPNGIVAEDVFDANDRIFGDPLGGFLVDGAGDVNGDGFADVTVGAPARDLTPNDVPVGEGAAYIFLGGPSGLGATSVTQADTTILGTISAEALGRTVAGPGDIDGDGFDDWVVGALHYAGSLDSEGVAYIYRGSAQGISASTIAQADSRLEASQEGAARLGNRYGFDAQGAGDVDNDGFIDIIVGKAFYDNGELNEGAAFLYNGSQFPANPNTPPVPVAGADQDVLDVDADRIITVTVDGTASFDPDGSIVSYEWYQATNSAATGAVLVGTGPIATFELSTISPIAAYGHLITLVVTDDQGIRRGDVMAVFPGLAPTTFEFAEWLDLGSWNTTGDVTLADAGVSFPTAPHVLMRGNSTLARTFTPAPGTTGLDITYWARGDAFGPNDIVNVQASFDGGPFVDYYSFHPSDAIGEFTFYGGSALQIPLSWWPAKASTVTLRFASDLSPGADFWLQTLRVNSIQAETGGATNMPPTADAGLDRTVVDNDGSGDESVTVSGSGSFDLDGTIASYEWRDGATTIGNAVDLTTTLPVGTHTLTLFVVDDLGANGVANVTITVLAQPGGPTLDVDLEVGQHTISLTVTDDDGAIATDTVVITVEAAATNTPPTANAGPDQTLIDTDNTGVELFTLDASGSSDPEGPISSYAWFEDGAQIAAGVAPDVPLTVGIHTITLTVTDGDGASASDTVVLTVDPPDPVTNQPPIANAGPDLNLADPDGDGVASAMVDGTGSSDVEGPIASYEWRLNGVLVGTSALQGIPFPIGVNTLELTVRDSDDATGTDTAIVTVAANEAPVAAAGPDQTVEDADDDGSAVVSVTAAGSSDADGLVSVWSWREGANVLATTETANLTLPVGQHTIELTITDNGGATAVDTLAITVEPAAPPGGGQTLYVSSSSGGAVGGVNFADEDILAFDTMTATWSIFLDGSDVGLSGAGARDVDAFTILDDGSVLLSIVSASTLPDVGAIDDSDIVRFVPTSTGASTAGTFEMYFDGSDVSLTSNGEDVDSIAVLANGDLLLSTTGSPSVPGLSGLADEDLIRFTPTSLGSATAGAWERYFDGSDVALNNSGSEDVHGAAVAGNGDMYLTTRGTFAVAGVAGSGSEVFTCLGHSIGAATSCGSHTLFFDGAANGFGSEVVDGIHVVDN